MATGTADVTETSDPPRRPDPPAAPRPSGRVALGAVAGLAATLLVVLATRLFSARPLGVTDNGDGYRLYCGAGLRPDTLDGVASWQGGWVWSYALGPPTCADPVPSSALVIARATTLVTSGTWSPAVLGWTYAVLVGLVVGLGAWAAAAAGRRRALAVAVPVLPLAAATFPRFFVSTYSEPAALLGTVAAAVGVAAVLVTRREHRSARVVALVLTAGGGLLATTAKVAYVPVLVAAVLVCAVTAVGVRRARRAGPALAALTVLLAAVPVTAALERQQEAYESVNAHDLVFTTVLVELGPPAAAELGLPPEAVALTGNGFYNGPPRPEGQAWWEDAIVRRPGETRNAALALLAGHPAAAARAVGVGLQATTRADLPYLDALPASPSRLATPSGDPGWSGARQPDLAQVLDDPGRPAWLPSVLVLVALAAAATARWQGRARRWSLAAGLAAGTALALVVVAVAGDGYFEVFKHVWLAAYLLVLAALALVGAVGTAVLGRWRVRRGE
ncbi:glycan biosynthesis hexose transferase WsfD [Actinomycetospora aeridis]|uniref:Dolichyl-phosphate-mannose-protein mannosyltransferase n=1 Tax=Actinomycetospora aeridis TaxID=3129231 RepID=A0ABU8NCT8_9PSEU